MPGPEAKEPPASAVGALDCESSRMVADAIRAADALGRAWKKHEGLTA